MLKISSLPLLLALATSALAEDWPDFRGANRDGLWNDTNLISDFDTESLKKRLSWETPIGPGYAQPTIADGRVYVTDRLTQPKQVERVHCLDEQTGKILWTYTYDCVYRRINYDAGPRAAVVIRDGKAYAFGSMGHLHCLDAKTGQLLWARALDDEYTVDMPIWGLAATPLIEGDLIITHIAGADNACFVAFNKVTGKEVWRALDYRAQYASPVMIEQAGRRVMVAWANDWILGLDPATGATLWSHEFESRKMPLGVASPVVLGNKLFITGFYDGSLLLELNPDKLEVNEVWRRRGTSERNTDALHTIIATPMIIGSHVYGMDSYGEMRCLDLMTGDRVWENKTAVVQDRWATIHFVKNRDDIWMFTEEGNLILAKLSPAGFEQVSRAKIIEPTERQSPKQRFVCWAPPAYANRSVFVRSDEKIIRVNLAHSIND
ncbi:MAG: PQQ-binding-like beta-propeller repeat protein [Planctomycetota bacterium]|jgi:outer membrane protein assembly factor BamB